MSSLDIAKGGPRADSYPALAMAASTSLSVALTLVDPSVSLRSKPSVSFLLPTSTPPLSLSARAPSSRFFAASPHEALESRRTLEPSAESQRGSEGTGGFEVGGSSEVASSHVPDAEKLSFCDGGSPGPLRRTATQLCSSSNEVSSISQQKIVIRNNFGENLVGVLHEAGSRGLVILCHGFRSSKESKTITNLADVLAAENISVFRFDFAGNGDSEGSFQYGGYWREVEDLRVVILYFSSQRREASAIVGHSKGGNVVLLYASKYHDISTVVNISGRFNLERGIEERLGKDFMARIKKDKFIDVRDNMGRFVYRVTEESLMDRLSTDMHTACMSINPKCRVLTVHGSQDDVVPPEDALEFAKSITNHRLHIVEGADHRYLSHQCQLAEILLEFVRSTQGEHASVLGNRGA